MVILLLYILGQHRANSGVNVLTFYFIVTIELIMDAGFLFARYIQYYTVKKTFKSLNEEKDKAETAIRNSTMVK